MICDTLNGNNQNFINFSNKQTKRFAQNNSVSERERDVSFVVYNDKDKILYIKMYKLFSNLFVVCN